MNFLTSTTGNPSLVRATIRCSFIKLLILVIGHVSVGGSG